MHGKPGAPGQPARAGEHGRGRRIARAASAVVAELEDAVAAGQGPAATARFWSHVEGSGTPLVEALGPGECAVTFVWRDPSPAARPYVLANKLHDRTDPEGSAMCQVAGTDVWHLTYRLPSDWRGSYQIGVGPPRENVAEQLTDGRRRIDDGVGASHADPRCGRTIGRGADVRSVAELPDAPAQPYVGRRPGVAAGSLRECLVAGHVVWVYEPQRLTADAAAPLAVVLDGELWAGELGLATTLDNLTADGRIEPAVVAMVATGAGEARSARLIGDTEFAGWLVGGLIDWLRDGWPVSPDAQRTVFAGQSLGGLAAMRAALAFPGRVGNVLAQSASLWAPAANDPALVPSARHRGLRVWMEVGSDEWINVAPNERFAEALSATGADVSFRTYRGGHDRVCWRGGIADGLTALLPAAPRSQGG